MAQVPLEELLERCPSIYKLVVMAARRAKQLTEGAPKLVEGDFRKVTTAALEEIRQGKVVYAPPEDETSTAGKGKRGKGHAGAKKKKA